MSGVADLEDEWDKLASPQPLLVLHLVSRSQASDWSELLPAGSVSTA